ncbi:NAD(P)-dependent oxidoreductase [Pseudobacillus wudalianchiensis]|uniref:precorrin-2 dehydrogenase n=1 Tax=Pseudobacillus wudalianchiensis TaxID=1743143 RepID=A0A1B9ADV8_9BACI|nr:NAD(P)-dependent oxidoreductase [Bacillus wudalianchiensis]OCA82027.1 siroheme synthase [Bacillus wudalianchiensis]
MFPIMVDLTDEKIVVVGGGEVALHKINNLLRFGLHVHVVSPAIHPEIERLASEGFVTVLQKLVEEEDYHDAFLVMTVTDSKAVNDEIARRAKAAGKLVVHAEQPDLGNSTIPASLQRGRLVVSVSTGGASPTLAKQIRNQLEEQYDESYEDYLDFLYEVRQVIKKVEPDRAVRRHLLKIAADPIFYKDIERREAFLHEIRPFAHVTTP